jgi:hypothetical protein
MGDVFGLSPGLEDKRTRRIEEPVTTIWRSPGVVIVTAPKLLTGAVSLYAFSVYVLSPFSASFSGSRPS